MSWYPLTWAETAPVADTYERAILTLLAHRASGDGTGAYPSISKMAEYAVCDAATVKRRLSAMRRRGLIDYGNQAMTRHLPRDKRPKVYDLLIPFGWYSAAQMEEVNRERAQRGARPLREEDRPPLATPDRSRKTRADKGQPKPRKTSDSPSSDSLFDEPGALVAPPVEDIPEAGSDRGSGGASSTPAGVLLVQSGGASSTPIHNLPTGETDPDTPGGEAPPPDPAPRNGNSPTVVVTGEPGLETEPTTACAELNVGDEATDSSTTSVEVLQQEQRDLDAQLTGLAARSKTGGAQYAALARRAAVVAAELTRRGVVTSPADPQDLTTAPATGRSRSRR